MKLKEIYQLAIEMGKQFDPRGDEVNRLLEDRQKEYEKMSNDDRAFFDKETLSNPYNDTRILYGLGEEMVKSLICGIDMETPEIILADRLREKGRKIDLVIAHHPEGSAQADLYNVMQVQSDMMAGVGVPINIAEGLMEERIAEVRRAIMPLNHQRAIDAARLLDLPFMCVHSPADNLVSHYLENTFLTNLSQPASQFMSQIYRHGHKIFGLIGGITKHHTLVTGSNGFNKNIIHFSPLSFQGLVNPQGNVRGLFIQRSEHCTSIAIKTILGPGISYFADCIPNKFRYIHITSGCYIPGHKYQSGSNQCFCRYSSIRILFQYGIQDSIRYLVCHFIRVPFSHRL
jgi:hypothetical protein